MTRTSSRLPLTITTPEDSQTIPGALQAGAVLITTEESPLPAYWLMTRSLPPPPSSRFRATTAEPAQQTTHGTSCVCCIPRSEISTQLLRLFHERARGECAFFRHIVLAVPAEMTAPVVAAFRADTITESLFELRVRE